MLKVDGDIRRVCTAMRWCVCVAPYRARMSTGVKPGPNFYDDPCFGAEMADNCSDFSLGLAARLCSAGNSCQISDDEVLAVKTEGIATDLMSIIRQ